MSRRGAIFAGGILLVAVLGASLASSAPDGLETVAASLGFAARAQTLHAAPLADAPGPGAGLLGALLVGALAWGAGRLLARSRRV